MISKLKIKNFALIKEQEINFTNGLNVLSGETGAGKSILINAINFILGNRADKSYVRTGEQLAEVNAVFELENNNEVLSILQDFGIEQDVELVISRKLFKDGKNEIRVNGEQVNLTMLKKVTSKLVDVYGQHEQQTLLNVSEHIKFIDVYAGEKLESLKSELNNQLEIKKDVETQIKEICGESGSFERELDILKFELNELNDADLKVGEDDDLLEKKTKMNNTQKVAEAVTALNNGIMGYDSENSVIITLNDVIRHLNGVLNIDAQFEDLSNRLSSVKIELDDIVSTSNAILQGYDWSESDYNYIEERLEVLKTIKRKYGGSIKSAIQYKEKIEEKINLLENSELILEKLNNQLEETNLKISELCNNISIIRKEKSEELELKLQNEFKELGMKNAVFKVNIVQEEKISNLGYDNVEFMFSANLGESLKPLAKVISGGEMSRFMLAFKVVFGTKNLIDTMIFDEIDSGISGAIGHAVACKLASISKTSQVITVTHLSTIGAMADNHLLIQKQSTNNSTESFVTQLDYQGQIAEIARLAGNATQINVALEYARQLKLNAENAKSQI